MEIYLFLIFITMKMNRSIFRQLFLLTAIVLLCCSACRSSVVFPDGESAYLPYVLDGIPFVVVDSAWAADMLRNHRTVVGQTVHFTKEETLKKWIKTEVTEH